MKIFRLLLLLKRLASKLLLKVVDCENKIILEIECVTILEQGFAGAPDPNRRDFLRNREVSLTRAH